MSILPGSIRCPLTLSAEAAIDRILQLDLSPLYVYDIDEVPAAALYDLADQFNVLGYRGWLLAETEQQRRNLIKSSIELHRTAGTPFAIKQALAAVGFPNTQITENPGLRYDGSQTHDGNDSYIGGSLGTFIVTLDPVRSNLNQNQITLIVALINEWKNARSHLLDLRIGDISLIFNALFHDGRIEYDGANSQTYSGELAL
jgi:P2-related tail formation protein